MFKIIQKISRLTVLQLAIFILQLLLLSCSCSKSTTDPPPPPPAGPDTTSHNFTWQIDTIGLYSSYLLDVAIVDENDIWAVGEIHTAETDTFDSLGNWIPPYNATHWNGQEWELIRFTKSENGSVVLPVRGILPVDENNVWLAAGSIYYWNGNPDRRVSLSYQRDITTDEIVKQLWGESNANIYGVGNEGIIVHYNGSNWQKLESGTTVDIQDIWGALDLQTGEYEILVLASQRFQTPQARELLQIHDTNVTAVSDSGLPLDLRSIWFIPRGKYYIAGNGLFYNFAIGNPWQHDDSQPLFYKDAIRGNDENDVIIAGSFGNVSHFNGSTWHHYENELPYFYGRYHSVNIKEDIMVAVGEIGGGLAIILHGIRN